ncbi:MAG: hypothetical protein LCH98_12185 [Actinobacteria bacterium]|nr:hypothetical protein [Actinomycetota bacterium]
MAADPKFKVLRRTRDRLRLTDRGRGRPVPPPRDLWGRDEFGDDGSAGVREPRRPSPRPPMLSTAEALPRETQLLELVAG